MSDIENLAHSTPKAGRSAESIKLKTPLNIFKIDLEKVDRAIDKTDPAQAGELKTNEERIEFIISAANPKLKRKRGQKTHQLLNQSNFYEKNPVQWLFWTL